jgi:protein-disulfide isomerase
MSNETNQTNDTPSNPLPDKITLWTRFKTYQNHINTGLGVLALTMAMLPYALPKASEQIVGKGLSPLVFDEAVIAYQGHKEAEANKAQSANLARIKADLRSSPDMITTGSGDSVIGPRNAPTKIYVFLDYNCGACRAVDSKVLDIIKQNPGTALVIKHYPVITEQSSMLASFALAAHDMGQFEKAHLILINQKIRSVDEVMSALSQGGLDAKSIYKLAQSPSVKARIDQSLALGDRLRLEGTPAYIIGDVLIPGGDIDQIKTVLKATMASKGQQS